MAKITIITIVIIGLVNTFVVTYLLQSNKCTGSGGQHLTATRLHQNAPNHIQNSKTFPGVIPQGPDRLEASHPDPVPDWESEKVAILDQTCLQKFRQSCKHRNQHEVDGKPAGERTNTDGQVENIMPPLSGCIAFTE